MGELVHDDAVAIHRIGEELAGVNRAGLVLEGEAQARHVVDDAADVGERVRAEDVRLELDDLGLAGKGPAAIAPVVGGSSATVPTIHVFGLGALPGGGPPGIQPSSVSPSASNDVVP